MEQELSTALVQFQTLRVMAMLLARIPGCGLTNFEHALECFPELGARRPQPGFCNDGQTASVVLHRDAKTDQEIELVAMCACAAMPQFHAQDAPFGDLTIALHGAIFDETERETARTVIQRTQFGSSGFIWDPGSYHQYRTYGLVVLLEHRMRPAVPLVRMTKDQVAYVIRRQLGTEPSDLARDWDALSPGDARHILFNHVDHAGTL